MERRETTNESVRFEEEGKVVFEAYNKSVGGYTYDGKKIPEWETLSEKARQGWIAAASAVIRGSK